jgi:hypothetical protein
MTIFKDKLVMALFTKVKESDENNKWIFLIVDPNTFEYKQVELPEDHEFTKDDIKIFSLANTKDSLIVMASKETSI